MTKKAENSNETQNPKLGISDVINRCLILNTEGNEEAHPLIKICENGRIFIRGEETYDNTKIGNAVKIFATYFPSTCL